MLESTLIEVFYTLLLHGAYFSTHLNHVCVDSYFEHGVEYIQVGYRNCMCTAWTLHAYVGIL